MACPLDGHHSDASTQRHPNLLSLPASSSCLAGVPLDVHHGRLMATNQHNMECTSALVTRLLTCLACPLNGQWLRPPDIVLSHEGLDPALPCADEVQPARPEHARAYEWAIVFLCVCWRGWGGLSRSDAHSA
eukprot:1158396-Pelagomonas_calceolata.AAC.20